MGAFSDQSRSANGEGEAVYSTPRKQTARKSTEHRWAGPESPCCGKPAAGTWSGDRPDRSVLYRQDMEKMSLGAAAVAKDEWMRLSRGEGLERITWLLLPKKEEESQSPNTPTGAAVLPANVRSRVGK